MQLTPRVPRRSLRRDRAVLVGVACFILVYTFVGIKFTLFARRYLILNGILGGLVLGLYFGDRDDSVAAAGAAAVLSVFALYVAFVLDTYRLASEFGVVPPLVTADPGAFGARLVVFAVSEFVLLLGVAPITVLATLFCAWLGSRLRALAANG